MSASNSASVRKKPARGRGAGYSALRERADATTKEARQLAMLVLEVLAGAKTPSESADVLGVSLPRYYALETRALAGLLDACHKKPKGRQKSPEVECERLRREIARLERECARAQALLRIAQRTAGVPAKTPSTKSASTGGKKKRRKRKPTVRALRAAAALRSADGSAQEQSVDNGKAPCDHPHHEKSVK